MISSKDKSPQPWNRVDRVQPKAKKEESSTNLGSKRSRSPSCPPFDSDSDSDVNATRRAHGKGARRSQTGDPNMYACTSTALLKVR